jgi:signal transduction histidine kinase
MRLQRKLLGLFLMLGAIAAINVAITTWALRLVDREVARPLAEIQQALGTLYTIKRASETIGETIGDQGMPPERFGAEIPSRLPSPAALNPEHAASTPDRWAIIDRALIHAREAATSLAMHEASAVRIGANTAGNLLQRVEAATTVLQTWRVSPTSENAATAGHALFEIHELIERVEGRVLAVAGDESVFQGWLQRSVMWILVTSIGALVLAVGLSLTLVRRWIIEPVATLRDAAAAYAQGQFEHRAPVLSTDELGSLGSEFNHMAGTIARMQEERLARERVAAIGEMVRRLVHNIRTPIAGVRGLAELTKDDLRDVPTPVATIRDQMDRIIRTVDGFEHWLKDLLNTTRPLDLRPADTNIRAWLERTIEPLRALASSSAVSVEVRVDPRMPATVTIDAGHLGQALVGIVNNAIQASPPQTQIRIEAGRDGAPTLSQDAWTITVEDQGPGIPSENHTKVFLPHFTTKSGGTGIGLAVAKQTIEQHGGRIWIEAPTATPKDAQRPGTRVCIRLPLNAGGTLATGGHSAGSEEPLRGQNPDHRR